MDEYDTPLQEAYVHGYWKELAAFTRNLFNATFKTNPYLERAVMTGITRVSKESIFSDLNNLQVVTTTSDLYAQTIKDFDKAMYEENIPLVKQNYEILCKMLHPKSTLRQLLKIQMAGMEE